MTRSFVEYVALAIISIASPKPSFSDLQQSKKSDRRMGMRQLRWLFGTLPNSKMNFNVKNHEVKKISLKSFVSMVALVNSTTATSSLALLPVDFKPSLQQLAEQFLWIKPIIDKVRNLWRDYFKLESVQSVDLDSIRDPAARFLVEMTISTATVDEFDDFIKVYL